MTEGQTRRFMSLFSGLTTAFGTGRGEWIKRHPTLSDFHDHLEGRGPGIGIAPLRPDNTVRFAAIDLDEPDFDAAREMQTYIPGQSWIERSRSGNAHIWVFFKDPIEAWLPMGILKTATFAANKQHVEVFPKNHDFAKVRLGNYINLPYHGSERPIITFTQGEGNQGKHVTWTLDGFMDQAFLHANDPAEWRKRAAYLQVHSPENRERTSDFGTQRTLHKCAEHILSGEAGPITEGHRNAVFFMLASCLSNWEDCSHDEALELMKEVNEDLCKPPESEAELRRILSNVERAGYTSTRCDDPLVLPFTHPDCRIAHPRR